MKKITISAICLSTVNIVILVILLIFNHFHTPSAIFDKVDKSIVEVKASTGSLESYGSGVVINKNGYLITNNHVISYIQNLELHFYNNIEIRTSFQENYVTTEIVSYDSSLDLAILKIQNLENLNQFKKIKFTKSDNLRIGDKCYSVGNASNLSISMSEGIISNPSINLQIEGVSRKFIQSDISIASGSSGGALLNSNGDLVGITTLRIRDNTGSVIYGYGYSIPSNQVLEYINSNI
ncbi:MAG: trypsin-like peptidase domain-containing protein [Bacillales bacterium]|jgi:serine protease DegS|nr:trypsin-like peptidase domain-containing protein [Bacillales bacterium]